MTLKEQFGIEPQQIEQNMINALSLDQELLYRLESRNLLDEVKIVRAHARSCYKTLAQIANYLEMQRYKNGVLRPCAFDLSEFCDDLFSRIRSKMRKSSIKLQFDIERGIVCLCDPDRLATCLTNLIVNAYTWVDHDEGKIKAVVKQQSGCAAVTIIDDGYGMSQAELDERRLSDGTKGLNVVNEFCKTVGTAPLIETTELGGFGIIVRLPLAPLDTDIRFEASVEPFKSGLFSPCEVLLYKLDDAMVFL